MGGFLLIAIGMLFVEGVQTLARAGLDPQKAIVVGLAFSIGLGMQHQNILADLLPSPWGALLGNGMTIGTVTAIALTAFLELTSPRSRRLEVRLDIGDLPQIRLPPRNCSQDGLGRCCDRAVALCRRGDPVEFVAAGR